MAKMAHHNDPKQRKAKYATKGKARTFGQDLMRKEHIVGGGAMNTRAITTTEWMHSKGLGGGVSKIPNTEETNQGTSIFDPVLCEIAYKWFCTDGGVIVDPFAGGSVRGIVAAYLGYQYIGVDLRPEQIEANREQAATILGGREIQPAWQTGNSLNIDVLCKGVEADFIFSCPPYFDLEVYSDNPDDLSTLSWDAFKAQYAEIIAKTCAMLKENRFACFVVGDVRDKKGFYRNFHGLTVECFEAAGLRYYNDIVLVNVPGSLPIRVGKQFESGRKVGKMHQQVLVFYKGDSTKIKGNFGAVHLPELWAVEGVEEL